MHMQKMRFHNEYLVLLKRVNDHGYPVDFAPCEITDSEYRALAELVEAGYLRGEISSLPVAGTIKRNINGVHSTVNGRIFQESIEEKLSTGWLKRAAPHVITIVIGVVIGVVCTSIDRLLAYFLSNP